LKTPIKVHLALLIVSLIYGSTYVIAKGVMPLYLGPSAFIFIRITVAGVLFHLLSFILGREEIASRKDYIDMAIAGLFGVAANMLLFFNGLSNTNELNASTLMLNAPIFVLLFSRLLSNDKVSWQQVIGIIISAIGAIMLIGGRGFQFDGLTAKGDLMILLNATSFAFYLVYSKRILAKYKPLTMIRIMFVFGWFFVFPFAFQELREADYASFPSGVWLSIGYVSVATTFLAYLLNAWAVKNASPTIAGSYIYLQPLIATSIAIAIGKQLLSIEKVIFAVLIFVGVYLVSKYNKRA
jgi:drug/metabolite transporter (DMT)-like permease